MLTTAAAHNSALRRRANAARRRQDLYAKQLAGWHRVLNIQRPIYKWVRPHSRLGKNTTPAMTMKYGSRPISMHEILMKQGLHCVTH